MSKIGGWHACYNSDRAISNELGGKWTKFYEYTFESTHAEGFEFPTDLEGNPLNLNGLYIIITKDGASRSLATTLEVNGDLYHSDSSNLPSNSFYDLKTTINNGMSETWFKLGSGSGVYKSRFDVLHFIDSITSFKFNTTLDTGDKIEFYVLRGV